MIGLIWLLYLKNQHLMRNAIHISWRHNYHHSLTVAQKNRNKTIIWTHRIKILSNRIKRIRNCDFIKDHLEHHGYRYLPILNYFHALNISLIYIAENLFMNSDKRPFTKIQSFRPSTNFFQIFRNNFYKPTFGNEHSINMVYN